MGVLVLSPWFTSTGSRGSVLPSPRFQVDFQLGNSMKPRADVAFHFNPRFKRASCIVCNTLTKEKWGREEITYDMPFRKEKSFEIVFMVLKNKFQVDAEREGEGGSMRGAISESPDVINTSLRPDGSTDPEQINILRSYFF